MKQYCGKRTIDGIVVTVDDAPLDERFDVQVFDEKGFEWSYEGSAPRQLALAILLDHLNDVDKANNAVEMFVTTVIANLDNDWVMSSAEIDAALSAVVEVTD